MSRAAQARRRRGRARGQSLVELAIVTPLLLLLLMGTIDVGRMIFIFIAIEDAVQEGSVWYSYNPSTTQALVQGRVRGSSSASEVEGAAVTISGTCTTTAAGLWVEGSTPAIQLLTPGARQIFADSIVLTSRIYATNLKGSCP